MSIPAAQPGDICVIVERSGPFGAKAIAEIPKDGVAPALASAINDATGVWIRQIPYTPEKVWRPLKGSEMM
jgi:putative selenate reductase molybdopterin-binding subunit